MTAENVLHIVPHARAFPRRDRARVVHQSRPPEVRGRRECRVKASPMAPVHNKKHGEGTTGEGGNILGLKRSSQHSRYGGCDGHSKEAINTGAAGLVGTTACCGACRTGAVLAGDSRRVEQRRCCAQGWTVTCCRTPVVPKGRWHASSDVQIFGKASLWAVPLVGRARGDRASQCPGAFSTGDWAAPRTGWLDNLP